MATSTLAGQYSDDILQPLQDSDLLRYRDICAKHLPATIAAHHFLTIQHRWRQMMTPPKDLSPRCINNFYAPRDCDTENCTFIAISGELSSDRDSYRIFPFTLEPSSAELIDCLRKTSRIEWQLGPFFQPLSIELMQIVEELLTQNRIDIESTHFFSTVWISNENALGIDVNIPHGLYFDALNEQHAVEMNERWTNRDSTSANYIRSIIRLNGGLGMFEKSTKRILAWVALNDHFALGFLETIPSERRKGLAKLLVQKFIKQSATGEQLDMYAQIGVANFKSLKLFESVGFKELSKCARLKVTNITSLKRDCLLNKL